MFYIPSSVLHTCGIYNNRIRYEHSGIRLLILHLYVPGIPLLYVPVNALQPSDTDGCSGSRGRSASNSVSFISESSDEGSDSGPTLERVCTYSGKSPGT